MKREVKIGIFAVAMIGLAWAGIRFLSGFDIFGRNSDYYAANGTETVTCVGCVLTGDLNLINLDSEGQVVEDAISFNAKDIT